MENTVKHHIYLDKFVMGSIYVKYMILVKTPKLQIPSSWPHVQACIPAGPPLWGAIRLRRVVLQSAKLLFPVLFPASSLQLPVCQSGILTYSCLGFSNLGLVTVYWTPGMGDNPNLTV